MDTKNQAVKVTKILYCVHKFKNMKHFPPGLLPTTEQVICRVLNEDSFF